MSKLGFFWLSLTVSTVVLFTLAIYFSAFSLAFKFGLWGTLYGMFAFFVLFFIPDSRVIKLEKDIEILEKLETSEK